MEMKIYAMDACFQIGQGGRKDSEWPKEVKQRIYLLVKCLGHQGLKMNVPIIFKYAMLCGIK